MARPKVTGPKVPVTLRLRRSTVDRIKSRSGGRSVGAALSAAVEARYGDEARPAPRPAPKPKLDPGHAEVEPRFKHG